MSSALDDGVGGKRGGDRDQAYLAAPLADHLLAGNAQVDRYAIKWEVFDVDGRANMYFGPLPALLRIPANWMAPAGSPGEDAGLFDATRGLQRNEVFERKKHSRTLPGRAS